MYSYGQEGKGYIVDYQLLQSFFVHSRMVQCFAKESDVKGGWGCEALPLRGEKLAKVERSVSGLWYFLSDSD